MKIPDEINSVILEYDGNESDWEIHNVQSRLSEVRKELGEVSEDLNKGAWAEVLAHSLTGQYSGDLPWGTYFCPIGSAQTESGEARYFPDISDADSEIVEHWKIRAQSLAEPRLVSRYSDLVWDLTKAISGERPDVTFARSAFDGYQRALNIAARKLIHRFEDGQRSLEIAIQINDGSLKDRARASLFQLHTEAKAEDKLWWVLFDLFSEQGRAGWTEEEISSLIQDMEDTLSKLTSAPNEHADAHTIQDVGDRLANYYTRVGDKEKVKSIYLQIAEAFHNSSQHASPMLVAHLLEQSSQYYRTSGHPELADQLIPEMEAANKASIDSMKPVSVSREIPKEHVEQFLSGVIAEDLEATLKNIAITFLDRKAEHEQALEDLVRSSPLSAMMPKSMLKDDMVVAVVGSYDQDPFGRLIDHVHQSQVISHFWLQLTFEKMIEKFAPSPADLSTLCNRAGLFMDGILLNEGLAAWLQHDHIKAAHILPFQIESGFRQLAREVGSPTKKPNPRMSGAWLSISLGDLLYSPDLILKLGPNGADLALHLQALLADVRGQNIRNDIAHGLLSAQRMDSPITNQLVHAVLLLGFWLTPVEELIQT